MYYLTRRQYTPNGVLDERLFSDSNVSHYLGMPIPCKTYSLTLAMGRVGSQLYSAGANRGKKQKRQRKLEVDILRELGIVPRHGGGGREVFWQKRAPQRREKRKN
ncbi:hypothetical protein JW930_03450 [Candidatus Woesearchaeota archaeon]|nr:hypothetical protein [Candidatus Woesearchaeota archaeon]